MANKDFKVKNGIDIQSPLPVAMGGTGQTSTTNTLNSLLPAQVGNANKVLQTDGTNTAWYSVPAAYTRGGMAGRPVAPTAGDLYFNTDKKAFEVWTGSAWVSVAVNGAVPLAPTIGTVTLSGLTASIPFTGPTDFGDAAITTYTATSSPGSLTASNASSPISISGLSQSTSYTFSVTATNSYGTSNASSASNSVTTLAYAGAPTSVSATDPAGSDDGYALVSWTAPASNGGSSITDYVVQYSSNSGSSWTTFSDGTSTSTSATVTGLTLNTAYIFRVAAVNALGTGPYSDPSSSFTPLLHDSGVVFPIESITVGSAGASSITFSNIPQTYTHLQIRAIAQCSTSTSTWQRLVVSFNSNTTNADYADHLLYGDGTSAQALAETSTRKGFGRASRTGVSYFAANVIDILDYANTNKYKTSRTLTGIDSNGNGQIALESNLWMKTNAITAITITIEDSSNFNQYSSFALYGIRSS